MIETSTSFSYRQKVQTVLRVLYYFEIFAYPLTEAEIFAFLQTVGITQEELHSVLTALLKEERIFREDDFYLSVKQVGFAERRKDLNARAESYMPMANRMARLIGAFPFVRAVLISGSLSKKCMAPDGDIDFFIITAPGRLWLSRTLLILFKKILLFNSHKYFCVNYFIDTEHLEVEEKNIFTATEIVTLLPMKGQKEYEDFCTANAWAWGMLPNFSFRQTDSNQDMKNSLHKRATEWCFSGSLGRQLDRFFMRFTVWYWKRKFRHLDADSFDLALKSRSYVSKHHPLRFQERVLAAYEKRLSGLEG